jgi:putative ABC transport system permease protein
MGLYRRLRNIIRPEQSSRELDDELSFHIAERIDELIASGLSEDKAKRVAIRQFGGYHSSRERTWDVDTIVWLEWIWKDIRLALRNFRRKPLFFVASVLILGLGIGATTTIYSVVDTVVLRALPYPDAERLLYFDHASHSFPQWRVWQNLEAFDIIGAAYEGQIDLTREHAPERLPAMRASPDFLHLIGATAVIGRLFAQADYPGTDSVAIISYGAWERIWAKDPNIVGRRVRFNGKPVEVIGVLSSGVRPPDVVSGKRVDVWFPLEEGRGELGGHNNHVLDVIGRIRRDVSIAAAQAQVDATQAAFAKESPRDYIRRNGTLETVPLVPLQEVTVRSTARTLWILLGAVAFMHLIACANVANLFLARGSSRVREIALRGALGASRWRIAAQVLTESIAVAVIGGLAGVVLANLGVQAFLRWNPGGIPRLDGMAIDLRIFLFAVALSVFTGIVFGFIPATDATRRNTSDAMKDSSAATSGGRRSKRLRSLLVVLETALAMVLLIGAGLLFRTFLTMMEVDPGFRTEKLVIVPLSLDAGYKEADRRNFVENVISRIETLPGVHSVSGARFLPFEHTGPGYHGMRLRLTVNPAVGEESKGFESMIHFSEKNFFTTLGVPIAYGRDFSAADMSGQAPAAILNRGTARRLFGEENVVGRTFSFGVKRFDVDTFTVVGVVDGVRQWGVTREIEDDVYVPYAQFGTFAPSFEVAVRTDADAGTLMKPIRDAIWSIDPNLPIAPSLTMEQRVSLSVATPRFLSILFAVFAAISLLLSCSGVLSSLLYTVSERRRELGIRLALGATNSDVLHLVLRYGLMMSLLGIAIGIISASALSRLLMGLLWNVKPTDPTTFVGVSVILCASALFAALFPAWNASRTNPIQTLRGD